MKRINFTHISAAALIAMLSGSAAAQDLSTQITVDRIIAPEHRDAARPNWAPALLLQERLNVDLLPAEYLENGAITPSAPTISPALWADTVAYTPYRGYASLGYFPIFNLGANAGYRFVSTPKVKAGAWMQYDGNKYSRHYSSDGKKFEKDVDLRNHFVTLGADGAYRFNSSSAVSAAVAYQYANVLRPSWMSDNGVAQGSNNVDFNADYNALFGNIAVNASTGVQHFGFGKQDDIKVVVDKEALLPMSQTAINYGAGVALQRSGYRWIALDVKGIALTANDGFQTKGTLGVCDINPSIALAYRAFSARLGLTLSLASGDKGQLSIPNESKLRVYPDVRLAVAPSSLPIAAYVNIGGNQHLTPIAQLFAIDPYCSTMASYGLSRMPFNINAGVVAGPISGFSIEAYGSMAKASKCLLPVFYADGDMLPYWASALNGTLFHTFDATCWKAGAKASYAFRSIVAASVGCEIAGSNNDYASWHEWMDRGKMAINASVKVTPIDRLSITASYELRTDRHGINFASSEEVSLGDISNLSLAGSYAITPQFTAFAQVENILNQNYLLISGLPAQGIKGLLGVAYKF